MRESRVFLLAGCVALGAVIGIAGEHFTGDTAWYLAIPLCIAVGWFVLADPTACSPRSDDPGRRSRAEP
jgi:hypothetical protein